MSDRKSNATEARGCRARIEELLTRRCEACSKLKELSRQQNDAIEGEGSVERLMIVLGRKQRGLAELEMIAKELRPLVEVWRAQRDTVPMEERARIQALAGRAREALREALELEAEACERIGGRRASEVERGTTIQQARRAAKGYAAREASEARMFDRRS